MAFVEFKGVIEVRTESENPDDVYEPIDMLDFQEDCPEIPEDYCLKNYRTGEQSYFFCLVCLCPMHSVVAMTAHIKGKKHINQTSNKKKIELGMHPPPLAMPKLKEKKTSAPRRPETHKSLVEKLKDNPDTPALGLQFVTEFINPRRPQSHRMYSCELPNCKAAWGTSEDMFNHVKGFSHIKNFLVISYPKDPKIRDLNKSEVLIQASLIASKEKHDYRAIAVVEDERKYREISNRPGDWSEKKARLGVYDDANLEPIRGRKRRHSTKEITGNGQDVIRTLSRSMKLTKEARAERGGKMFKSLQILSKHETSEKLSPQKIEKMENCIQIMNDLNLTRRLQGFDEFLAFWNDLVLKSYKSPHGSEVSKLLLDLQMMELDKTSVSEETLERSFLEIEERFKTLAVTSPISDLITISEVESGLEKLRRHLRRMHISANNTKVNLKQEYSRRFLVDVTAYIDDRISDNPEWNRSFRDEWERKKFVNKCAEEICAKEVDNFLDRDWSKFHLATKTKGKIYVFLTKKMAKHFSCSL